MKGIQFLLVLMVLPVTTHGATFHSARDGNWSDDGTWVEAGSPDPKGGDVVVIGPGHEVTVPKGLEVKTSGTLADSGGDDPGKLIINGRLTLDGDLVLKDHTELHLGPGATLDLDGHTVFMGRERPARVWLRFHGAPGDRARVSSTNPGGTFTTGAASCVGVDFDQVDVAGLGDCRFGSRGDPSQHCKVRNAAFTGSGDLSFSFPSMPDAGDVVFEHCDFRKPTGKDNYLVLLTCGGDAPTGRRTITHCTFDGEGRPAQVRTIAANLTVDHCVFEDASWSPFVKPGQKVCRSFFHTSVHNCLITISGSWKGDPDVEDCYVFADGKNPHSVHMGDGRRVTGCVFEANDPETNHVIPSRGVTIERCIVLGTGTLCSSVSQDPGAIVVRNNTIYATRTGSATPMLILTEGRGTRLTGTCIARNNLLVDADTSDKGEYGIGLADAAPNQVQADYNNFYGYPGGDVRVHYHVWLVKSDEPGNAITYGGHDLNLDPKFVDRNRNLAAWDASLGGPGTAAHAITELLKLNGCGGAFDPRYNIDALLACIREGFTPRQPLLDNAGDPTDGSPDIGAVDFGKPGGAVNTNRQQDRGR